MNHLPLNREEKLAVFVAALVACAAVFALIFVLAHPCKHPHDCKHVFTLIFNGKVAVPTIYQACECEAI